MKKLITAHFTVDGVPQPGLAPVIDIIQLGTAPTSSTPVVSGGLMSEIGGGWYRYDFVTYDLTKDYVFNIDGGATLENGDRYKYGGNESYVEDITTSVLDEPLINYTSTGGLADTVTKIKADTATIMINEATMVVLLNTLLKYQRNRTKINPNHATMVIFDDDGITPLTTFDLRDFNGMPSVQEVCERMPHF